MVINDPYMGEMQVFIKVEYNDGRLSITGVEGPKSNGDAKGGCGQIDMSLREDDRSTWKYNNPWNDEMMDRLLQVWDDYHLNDMQAGTPKQTEFIKQHKHEFSRLNWYTEACEALSKEGLLYDYDYFPPDEDGEKRGYRYGTAWLAIPVPEDVLDFLFNLPETRRQPAWC
jgi:hypothetical protein